jgi:5-oxoprolinase (ATP-hydrolysing)
VARGWRFAVDRGGTFTDLVAETPAGEQLCLKLLSEAPGRYRDAAREGIARLLALHGASGGEVERVRVGTTVATNALLERTGARTALVMTAGLGDALAIGTQERPELFKREIVLPEPLYECVIEAQERLASDGEVLVPLDANALAGALRRAREAGCEAVAIAFLHGWRYPAHEQEAQRVARAVGFAQVSVSHEVGALERIVMRGASTVVDAYLTPVVRAYVTTLEHGLADIAPNATVEYMQSHGGLAAGAHFRGPGALLSGPAGGLVGMVGAGRALGRVALVGFDMGGTSTDVSVYDGHFERRYESEIAGQKLASPMLDIHTVAAGGGSVLSFESGRFRVGPRSAGARPGPACYGLGGPLAVTDIHVALGRLRPECFPRVFGASGEEPLSVEPARAGFARLAREISDAGATCSPEEVAEGFLTVAIETMATAIKGATLGAGHDPARYTLVAFGGAGGQHACRVAETLGMREVLIHPLAGVLSALGIALAEPSAIRRATLAAPLDTAGIAAAHALAARLSAEAAARLPAPDQALLTVHADLRVASAEHTLAIALGSAEDMRRNFATAHAKRYGYAPAADEALLVEAITVEAKLAERAAVRAAPRARPAPAAQVRAYFAGAWREVPLVERSSLAVGATLDGPAILAEPTATTIVESGWSASVEAGGELLLRHRAARARAPLEAARPDAALLEVFHALFRHAAEQMGQVLRQTASSVNIRERLDYSCALFDADGALIANAPHMPVHLGSMGASVRAVRERHGRAIARGESYLVNSPYAGGTHLPDLTVVTPVFLAGDATASFWVASRAHHADVGGVSPGSMPPFSTDIREEGALFEGERIVRNGTLERALLKERLAAGRYPARAIERNLADLSAQLAANARGVAELERLCESYGRAGVGAYMRHVQDNAEAMVRAAARALAAEHPALACGAHAGEELDGGERIQVEVRLSAENGSAEVDFAGSSGVSPRNFNAPLAVCTAAVLYVFRTLVDADIPLNEGCLRPIRLKVPVPSLLAPEWPAAVVAGNVETSQCIVDALYGALGVLAGSQGTMNNVSFGNERCQYYETIAGGAGAGPGFRGASGVHTHMTNSRLTDPEVLETRLPVRVRCFAYRRGSGGKGRWPGGDGLVRELEFRESVELSILSNHRLRGPRGAAGGLPGAPGINRVRRADGTVLALGATAFLPVGPGDVLRVETPGGGGFGAPGEGG